MKAYLSRALPLRAIFASLLALVLILPFKAEAHAILVESTPAVNSAVVGPRVAFSLRYNSRIDRGRSKLSIVYPDQSEHRIPIADEGASDDVLKADAELPAGSYSLRWQVLAIDGHITRGIVPFTVGP